MFPSHQQIPTSVSTSQNNWQANKTNAISQPPVREELPLNKTDEFVMKNGIFQNSKVFLFSKKEQILNNDPQGHETDPDQTQPGTSGGKTPPEYE